MTQFDVGCVPLFYMVTEGSRLRPPVGLSSCDFKIDLAPSKGAMGKTCCITQFSLKMTHATSVHILAHGTLVDTIGTEALHVLA